MSTIRKEDCASTTPKKGLKSPTCNAARATGIARLSSTVKSHCPKATQTVHRRLASSTFGRFRPAAEQYNPWPGTFDIFMGARIATLYECARSAARRTQKNVWTKSPPSAPTAISFFTRPERKVLAQIETFAKPALAPQPTSGQRAG